jgi:biopolymer transport protein ExbD
MKDALSIAITKEATIALGDSKVDQKDFPAILEKEMRKNPFRKVLLSADKSLQFHTIRSVLNDLRDGGVTEVDLMGKRIVEEE